MKKILVVLSFITSQSSFSQQLNNIIPAPVEVKTMQGSFVISDAVTIKFSEANKELNAAALLLRDYIKQTNGNNLFFNKTGKQAIELKLAKTNDIGSEGYLLSVKPTGISITANAKAGIIYGIQTLLQLFPEIPEGGSLKINCTSITDYPRFAYRGMHLDVGRHFFPVSFVKRYIDMMASYKFNYFHWHLTEDQGWRIEIKKYPELTSKASYRNGTIIGRLPGTASDNLRYGGFYTQDEVREIVAYAGDRGITVIPEIEMPGHSSAAIKAYPWLSCFPEKATDMSKAASAQSQLQQSQGEKKLVQETWGVFDDIYCAGNDSTFVFLQNVLDEVLALFPSPYIHVGGDEAPKTHWKTCPRCQARIKAEHLKDEHELQSYFIHRMEKYLNGKGRTLIGWDEILEGGLAPNAVVMSWRGEAGGIEAAKQNHHVIMTPGNYVYFDMYQGDPATEPLAIGGFNTLKKVYDYDPQPKELNAEQAKYIMGAQANVWTEYIATTQHVEYMVLPRMSALSEVLWSPAENKNWKGYSDRLQMHFKLYEKKGWNYSQGNFKPAIKPLLEDGKMNVSLLTEAYNGEIVYTTDNTQPNLQSKKYTGPIRIDSALTLKASVLVNGRIMTAVPAQKNFVLQKSVGGKDEIIAQ